MAPVCSSWGASTRKREGNLISTASGFLLAESEMTGMSRVGVPLST